MGLTFQQNGNFKIYLGRVLNDTPQAQANLTRYETEIDGLRGIKDSVAQSEERFSPKEKVGRSTLP